MKRGSTMVLGLLLLAGSLAGQMLDSLILVRTDTIYFDFGKDELRPAADSVLQQLAADWKTGYRIYLTGHTDAVGTNVANDALANRRAAAAQQQLVAAGLPEAALLVKTFGENRPVAANDTEADRQRNRRVTLDLLRPQKYLEVPLSVKGADSVGIAAQLYFRGKTFVDSTRTDSLGRGSIRLPLGEVIGMEVYAPGHFFSTQLFKVLPGEKLPNTIILQSAKPGEVADIPDLYFVGNQDVLLPQSKQSLPRVLRFMQVNPKAKVEIAGHVNYPNSPMRPPGTFEYGLSVNRAKRVYEYLLANGIPASRMEYKGYSNGQMRFPQARSEADQAANRRVEIRILSVD